MNKKNFQKVIVISLGILGFIIGGAHNPTMASRETDEEFNSRMRYNQQENEELEKETIGLIDSCNEAGNDEERCFQYNAQN